MSEARGLHTAHSVEQLRAIADILRLRIVDLLQARPMTVTQLGDLLEMAPAKVHYHVRELERVGLLRLVETREKGGILEKYYQPVAKDISVSKTLFLTAPPDESLAMTSAWFDQVKDGFQQAFRVALEQKDEQPNLMLAFTHMHVTPDEHKQLAKQLYELLKPYENPRGVEGEMPMLIATISYPQMGSSPVSMEPKTVPIENNWTVGMAHFNRAQLERIVAEGRRLHINVTGICYFANDVSADLADQAIAELRLIGKLEAPAAVREVLLRKRA
jgi:DNA-binding transcriptional ArsR family regulator